MVRIEGGGIAGRVLRRELSRAGIASVLTDRSEFPRPKVCGGVLQWESWEYLRKNFDLRADFRLIERVSHFWRGKKIGSSSFSPPAVFVSRFELDAQMESPVPDAGGSPEIAVDATGAPHEGEWIGFQTRSSARLDELRMHYGRGLCLGESPTPENKTHIAFIVKRGRFDGLPALRQYVAKELGLELLGELKGTGRIRYGYREQGLSIGDARMTTFPFLGLGMRHAIDSARLMADCLAEGDPSSYAARHRRLFCRQRLAGSLAGRLYDSPLQGALRPFLSSETLFQNLYRWLHGQAVLE